MFGLKAIYSDFAADVGFTTEQKEANLIGGQS